MKQDETVLEDRQVLAENEECVVGEVDCNATALDECVASEVDCNSTALETMDSCVGFVEGVGLQHDFEQSIGTSELIESRAVVMTRQELSPFEASLIRSQIDQRQTTEVLNSLKDLDLLNICCSEDDTHRVEGPTSATTSDSGTPSESNTLAIDAFSRTFPRGISEENLQCAVCFDEVSSHGVSFATFPCCGQADETSSIRVCTACVLVLSNPTSDGTARVGRCLRCRCWIVIRTPTCSSDTELEITAVISAGSCKVCRQVKEHLVENASVCDACFFGCRYPLLYECENCHVTQRIPHPMYRYQTSPERYGNVTWACQGRCKNFTHWRIRHDQIQSIPVGDVPHEWGDDYLEAARRRILLARRQLTGETENSCSIL